MAVVPLAGGTSNNYARDLGIGSAVEAGEKEIGGSAHLNPLGLFVRTYIPFVWRVLSAFVPC